MRSQYLSLLLPINVIKRYGYATIHHVSKIVWAIKKLINHDLWNLLQQSARKKRYLKLLF